MSRARIIFGSQGFHVEFRPTLVNHTSLFNKLVKKLPYSTENTSYNFIFPTKGISLPFKSADIAAIPNTYLILLTAFKDNKALRLDHCSSCV